MAGFSECVVDEAVLRRARIGDRQAHAIIYRTFGRAVYTLACRMLERPALADEILQDTFVEVLGKIGTYTGEGPFAAWIRRIAVNKCLMHLRSGWQRYGVDMSRGEAHPGLGEPADQREPEGFAERVQARHDLELALARLSPVSRAVVWLHDVEGFTHKEIAAAMGKTVSFSKSQLARAHDRLQAFLDEAAATEGEETCIRALKSC
jgi:RNA polymerase sigma-70 factor (ECF subfamily)